MMDEELMGLVQKWRNSGEGLRLDFKQSAKLSKGKSLAKHLTAFSNRQGGKLVIGITDEGRIEGANLDEENCKELVSNAANDNCDPPVRTTVRFLSKQNDEDTEGDVVIIDMPSSLTKPHAVVSGKKRTYYIRTTNQSRPVMDSQGVRQLYLHSSSTIRDSLAVVSIDCNRSSLSVVNTKPFPEAYKHIRPYFDNLSDDDREYLLEDDNRVLLFYTEILPLAFLRSIGFEHDFWIGHAEGSHDDELILNVLFSNYEEADFDNVVNYDLSYRDRGISGVLSNLSIDPIEITNRRGIIGIPSGTRITVRHLTSSVPTAVFVERKGAFYFRISSSTVRNTYDKGLAESHPLTGLLSNEEELSTLSASLATENSLAFPDSPDPNIVQHTAFVQGWIDQLKQFWDWEYFVDESVDSLYRIEKRLDIIEEKIDRFVDQ